MGPSLTRGRDGALYALPPSKDLRPHSSAPTRCLRPGSGGTGCAGRVPGPGPPHAAITAPPPSLSPPGGLRMRRLAPFPPAPAPGEDFRARSRRHEITSAAARCYSNGRRVAAVMEARWRREVTGPVPHSLALVRDRAGAGGVCSAPGWCGVLRAGGSTRCRLE